MSSVLVAYPVEIKGYHVSVQRERAEIRLDGVEQAVQGAEHVEALIRPVGRMTFGDATPIGDKDFINRGGMLQMDRPLSMFSGILHLLHHEKPLFLREDGTLSTILK